MNKTMDGLLRKLQLTQLEILKAVDAFCRDNNIKYSLYAGTLLGAIRHKGFIPWDDDLDICMEREEYNRFVEIWERKKPKGYLLQNKENTPSFIHSFSKIRKEHTTFLEYEGEENSFYSGIFIDVFPIDRFPNGILSGAVFRWHCLVYQLLTREYIPPKGSLFEKTISTLILYLTPQERRTIKRQKLLSIITKSSDRKLRTVATETLKTIMTPLPANLFDEYTYLRFEGGEFMCFSNWDGYLTAKFGYYMTLPPESEREWKHHPLIVDFERSMDER